MSGKRALITGGAGFIGGHLAEKLLARSYSVSILDDLSTGRFENVAHLEDRDDVRIVIDSVMHDEMVREMVREADCVFHLASAVGVQLIMDEPVRTIETIFGGTERVLRECSRLRKPVLVTSTSEVYGKGVAVPFSEDDDVVTGATTKHRWAYACAKSLDEFLCLAHWKQSKMPVNVVRLFNTVGPRQSGQYGMVVPRFVEAAIKNDPIVVHGDGEQTRCFGHVADIVDALIRVIETPACRGEVINLGNNTEISINQLAQRAIALAGSSSKIVHVPYEEIYGSGFEDMRRRVPCLAKAQRLIGYQPTRTLDNILNDVIQEKIASHSGKR
jgi:UDP-glucose 4-epimerase